jgi:hypothetical protein
MVDAETQFAIEALQRRYATAADTRDAELLSTCFTEDVKANYGEQIGQFDSREGLVGHLSAMLGACGPTLHFITNTVLEPVAGEIKAKSYTHAVVYIPGMDAPLRTAGTYDDLLVKTSGGWQIKERVYTGIA